jgi:hypothetical protein
VAQACNPSYSEAKIRRITAIQSQTKQTVLEMLSRKYPTQNRAGGVTQVVKHLPSKCKAEFKPQYWGEKKNKVDDYFKNR